MAYLIAMVADTSYGTYCDDSFVVAQVASPVDQSLGLDVSRAIGFVRCGRNLIAVGHAVVGREYISADKFEFDTLLGTVTTKAKALPR